MVFKVKGLRRKTDPRWQHNRDQDSDDSLPPDDLDLDSQRRIYNISKNDFSNSKKDLSNVEKHIFSTSPKSKNLTHNPSSPIGISNLLSDQSCFSTATDAAQAPLKSLDDFTLEDNLTETDDNDGGEVILVFDGTSEGRKKEAVETDDVMQQGNYIDSSVTADTYSVTGDTTLEFSSSGSFSKMVCKVEPEKRVSEMENNSTINKLKIINDGDLKVDVTSMEEAMDDIPTETRETSPSGVKEKLEASERDSEPKSLSSMKCLLGDKVPLKRDIVGDAAEDDTSDLVIDNSKALIDANLLKKNEDDVSNESGTSVNPNAHTLSLSSTAIIEPTNEAVPAHSVLRDDTNSDESKEIRIISDNHQTNVNSSVGNTLGSGTIEEELLIRSKALDLQTAQAPLSTEPCAEIRPSPSKGEGRVIPNPTTMSLRPLPILRAPSHGILKVPTSPDLEGGGSGSGRNLNQIYSPSKMKKSVLFAEKVRTLEFHKDDDDDTDEESEEEQIQTSSFCGLELCV